MRGLCFGIAFLLGAVAVVWGGWYWALERRSQSELAQAEKDMADGRYRLARQRLAELLKRRPSFGEAAYQLGLCEENLRHDTAALAAWSSIRAGSPLHAKASIARARLLTNTGRLALAEELLASLPDEPGARRIASASST